MNTTTSTYTKPQPVLVFGAITTFLTVVFGGLTTVAGLQDNKTLAVVCGVGMLITAGLNQAKDFYLRGIVVPSADAAAYRDQSGTVVAGPASVLPEGAAVDVTTATRPVEDEL